MDNRRGPGTLATMAVFAAIRKRVVLAAGICSLTDHRWRCMMRKGFTLIELLVVIGIIFGIYPARQASLQKPVEALRGR